MVPMKNLPVLPILPLICFLGTLFNLPAQDVITARPYGEANLIQDFLCSEVFYPETDLQEGTEGTVVISFIVTEAGDVTDVRIKESVSPEIDREALRLFSRLLWEPATRMGQPVATINEFPIRFNIKKYQKHCRQRGYDRDVNPFDPVDSTLMVYETTKVDKPPYANFEDKTMSLPKFINANIRYPETAFRQSISGNVRLRFVVEPNGRVSNIKVLEPVSGGCTQEAIRLLELVKWMPGIKNGMAVRTFMNLDISFRLPEDSDMKMFENSQMNSN